MPDNKKNSPLELILAGMPDDVTITRYEMHEYTVELFVEWDEPKRGERICPKCGSTRCVRKDSGAMQTVRHTRSGMLGTLVTFRELPQARSPCMRRDHGGQARLHDLRREESPGH